MKRHGLAALVIGSVLLSFGMGYLAGAADPFNKSAVKGENKPVIEIQSNKSAIINSNTKIVLEKEYLRCNHIIKAKYPEQERLWGKTVEGLKSEFNPDVYSINMEANTLTIRQKIDSWCPADQEKCRIGEYNGRVAIFKGASVEHDVLLRVTEIKLDTLPAAIADDIRQGKYEFANEAELNDAMENLDEYI